MTALGFTYAISAALTWGIVYVLDQRLLKVFSPAALLFLDSAILMLVLLPVVMYERKELFAAFSGNSLKTSALLLLVIGASGLANFLILASIKILGASTASVFEISYPFFVALFAYLVFGTTLNIYFFLGAALIFAGSAIIISFA